MSANLPLDFFHLLGSNINSRVTLASLCLVSQTMNKIFTPFLYSHIRIENLIPNPLDTVSRLPAATHLKHTRTLYVGQGPRNWDGDRDREMDPEALGACVEKMVALESLAINNDLTRFTFQTHWCADASPQRLSHHPEDPDFVALESLAAKGTLRSLQISSSREEEGFSFAIPLFRNLTTLVLQGMAYRYMHEKSILSILVHSPQLQVLGLSQMMFEEEPTEEHSGLWYLCSLFQTECLNPGVSRLQLRKLDLGTGFRPESKPEYVPQGQGGQYIEYLTDLKYLKELVVHNCDRYEWYDESQVWEDWGIMAEATNITSLEVDRLTAGVMNFVAQQRMQNPDMLQEIRGCGDRNNITTHSGDDEIMDAGDALFALPTEALGPGWKKVNLNCALGGFAALCAGSEVEELGCRLPGDEMEAFMRDVLPGMSRLRVLVVSNADGLEDAQAKRTIAEEMFAISERAWKERDGQGVILTKLGLVDTAYEYALPRPDELGRDRTIREVRKVVELTKEEARSLFTWPVDDEEEV